MPRKERPTALAEGIFDQRLQLAPARAPGYEDGEIPVNNTFIHFDTSASRGTDDKSLSTAPAWIGPSLQSMLHSALETAVEEPVRQSDRGIATDTPAVAPIVGEDLIGEPAVHNAGGLAPLSELPSPKKVPVLSYSMSSSSARAAGIPPEPGLAGGAIVDAAAFATAVSSTADPPGAEPVKEPVPSDAAERDDDDEDSDVDGDGGDADNQMDEVAWAIALAMAEAGEIPSVGSKRHEEGSCKRCCFFPKGRCLNGHTCEFCHYEHEKRKRKKKKKSKTVDVSGEEVDVDGRISGKSDTPPRTCAPLTAPPPLPPMLPGQPPYYDGYDPLRPYDHMYSAAYGLPPYDPYAAAYGHSPVISDPYGAYPAQPAWPPPPAPAPPVAAGVTSAVTSGYAPVVDHIGRPLPPPR